MSPASRRPPVPGPSIPGAVAPGADAARDPERVRRMFDQIARRYDLLNTLLSAGRDAAWRRRAVREAGLAPGDRALDVCCGTGSLSRDLCRAVGASGEVIGVDFSAAMLEIARRRAPGVDFRQGDATRLEGIPDGSVDAVTIGFGLRNVGDRLGALRECRRVLRPGGRLVILEFAAVRGPLLGAAYRVYLTRVLPRLGAALNPRSGAYTYLPASIAAYPEAAVVTGWLGEAGLGEVRVVRLTIGIVTIHVATAPPAPR